MGDDLLGSIGGLLGGGSGSVLGMFDPGALVHKALDSILPPDLQFLGGVAGAITDFQCGNPVGALKEGMTAMSDLQDVSQRPPAASSASAPTSYEPEPPPSLAAQKSTTITTTSQRNGQFIADANAAFTTSDKTAPHGTPPATPAPSPWRGTPPAANAPSAWPSPSSSPLRATPPESAPPPEHGAAASSLVSKLFDATPAGMIFNALQGDKPSSADTSKLGKDQFMNLSDKDFMNAVRDGKIPKEVTDDPAAMLALQARMQHVTEMNQLMTSMMQALHQMRMSIIQNVRV